MSHSTLCLHNASSSSLSDDLKANADDCDFDDIFGDTIADDAAGRIDAITADEEGDDEDEDDDRFLSDSLCFAGTPTNMVVSFEHAES